MSSSQAAAGLALLAAACWGGSDFMGGLGARKAPAFVVVFTGQILALTLLLALCAAMHLPAPGRTYAMYALIGGFEGSISLALFYRALGMGVMGLTAAITALLTALVPVLFALFHDGVPGLATTMGLIVGLLAIWLVTHSSGAAEAQVQKGALGLATLAGLGFGAQIILFKMANPAGVLWTTTLGRVAGVTALVMVLAVMRPKLRSGDGRSQDVGAKRQSGKDGAGLGRGWSPPWWVIAVLAGLLDTTSNGFYVAATRSGRLETVAVICSLYPAGTIVLAALVLRERPTRRQIAGMALALLAVVLLSA